MGSILSEIKGSMTGFEKLTPELVEKLSCDGLTYDESTDADFHTQLFVFRKKSDSHFARLAKVLPAIGSASNGNL